MNKYELIILYKVKVITAKIYIFLIYIFRVSEHKYSEWLFFLSVFNCFSLL